MNRKNGTLTSLVAAACIAGYFFFFAGGGLRAGFTHDDLMNIYRSWTDPLASQLRDIALFFRFSSTYRPTGAVFYTLLFNRFGFDPLPFRMACYAVMLANLWLGYRLLAPLAGSRLVGGIAVLIFAYHGEFWGLYASTGTCYDLLCLFFYTAAFLYYLRARKRQFPLRWRNIAVWSALYILCLNSKEMAVTLPVLIAIYELLASPPKRGQLAAWIVREGRVPLVGAVLTAGFVFGRVLSTGGLSGYPGYRPVLSLGVYLASAFHYLRSAFYEPRWLTPVAGWLIAILLVAAALRWRSVPLRLGVAWVFIGILPVAFIPQRSLDAVSIPMLGLALCVSLGIAAAASRLRAPAPLVFGGTLVALVLFHAPHRAVYLRNEYREIWSAYQELLGYQRVHPFRAGSRILFLRDPFGDKVWGTTYLVYLASKDHSLTVNRVDHPEREPDPNQPLRFERVLSFADERLLECDAGPFQDLSARELAARAATAVCLEKP